MLLPSVETTFAFSTLSIRKLTVREPLAFSAALYQTQFVVLYRCAPLFFTLISSCYQIARGNLCNKAVQIERAQTAWQMPRIPVGAKKSVSAI